MPRRISILLTFAVLFLHSATAAPRAGGWQAAGFVPSPRSHPHFSLPNPDAPALKSFLGGSPAGAGLAGAVWPQHYRIGVVRVEFQPDENPATTGNGTWGDIPFFTFQDSSTGVIVQDTTIDSKSKLYIQRNLLSVSQYYEAVSLGKVIFEVPDSEDISKIYRLPNEMAEYGKDDDYSLRTSKLAVDAVQAADGELDFSKYDVVMVFHAGCGQHTDFDEKSPDDIFPVSINYVLLREILADGDPSYQGIESNDRNPDGSPFQVKFIQVFPETAVQDWEVAGNQGGPLQGLLGVICHELGHFFGLPDLYDTYVGTRPTLGFYTLMATGFYNSVSRIPSHPDAWSKVLLGWIEPLVVTGDVQNVLLKATELPADGLPQVLKVPISSTEYLLIELRLRDQNFNNRFDYHETGGNTFPDVMKDDYRLPDGSLAEFDWSIPNSDAPGLPVMSAADSARLGSGVLIWHVDEEVIRENFTRDLTFNTVNTEPQHLGIDLEEADGLQHLLEPFPASLNPGFGSPFDVFGGMVPGVKAAELGNLNLSFGPYTNPNSSSYTGVPSNLEVSGFRSMTVSPGVPVVDSLVQVDVAFDVVAEGDQIVHPLAGWPRRLDTGSLYSSPLVADIDPGSPGLEVVQVTDDGRVFISSVRQGFGAQVGDSVYAPPAAGDITGDGLPEVVVAAAGGMVHAWSVDHSGTMVPAHGWPASLAGRITAGPVLADVDGDGTRDVIVLTRNTPASARLHVLDENGSEVAGFPVTLDQDVQAQAAVLTGSSGVGAEAIFVGTLAGRLYSFGPDGRAQWSQEVGSAVKCAPVAGRLGLPGAGESFRVCAFTADGRAFCFEAADGSPAAGWPVSTGGSCLAGGALGDVDGDGLNELVLPVDFPDSTAPGRHQLFVLDYNGSSRAGFPLPVGSARMFAGERYLSAPAIADLDGDGRQDIVLATLGRLALTFAGAGGREPFMRFILGSNSLATPFPADIDGDGNLDLVCADGEGYIYAYATGSRNLAAVWPGQGGGPARTGMSLALQQNPGLTESPDVLPERFCYVYPNPVKGGRAHLSYRLGRNDVERVTVEVFTASGERVSDFEGTTAAADGLSNELSWEVDTYASGVYIVLVKAWSAGSGTARAVRKFAVIK